MSVTGQGGIGKSRLAWEFQKYLDGLVEPIFWHEGRSPSYGEGITFWSLGEMVRSRAHLLETDDPVTTRTRIAEMLAQHVPDEEERRRIEPALLALLGPGDTPVGGPAELFSAWRTFFERVAAKGVVVMLFEDLQWADPGTLDFIEHVLEWTRNVPILIVTLARPELLEQRPGWGAGKRAFLALDLQALDDASMRELLGGLVRRPARGGRAFDRRARRGDPAVRGGDHPHARRRRPAARAGGRHGYEPVGELGELAVPDTLHALIAARLDGLDTADRALVQDAADARPVVHDRRRRGGRQPRTGRGDKAARPPRPRRPPPARGRSAVARAGQYAFVQALIREVAYSTLSLRDRRSRHLAAARYFESIGDDELAGALAAHYLAAYRASTEGPEAEALVAQARIALRAAAERAIALGAPGQAVTFLDRAIEVTDASVDRAELHERAGAAAADAATQEVALGHFEAAERLYEEVGDRPSQARVAARGGYALSVLRRRDEAMARLDRALVEFADLGDDDPDPWRSDARSRASPSSRATTREPPRWPTWSSPSPNARDCRTWPRMRSSRWERRRSTRGRQWQARALVEGARKIAEEATLTETLFRALVMLPSITALDDPRGALATERDGIALARRAGNRTSENRDHLQRGRGRAPDRRLGLGGRASSPRSRNSISTSRASVGDRAQQVFFEVYRGTFDETELPDLHRRTEVLEDRDLHAGLVEIDGTIAHAAGDWAAAATAWMAVADVSDLNAPYSLPKAGRAAILAGDAAAAQAAVDRLAALGTKGRAIDADRAAIRAGLAALAGDRAAARTGYRAVMSAYRDLGLPWDEALVGMEAAQWLGDGDAELAGWTETARATFARLGAAPLLARLDEAIEHGNAVSAAAAGEPSSPSTAESSDVSVTVGEG